MNESLSHIYANNNKYNLIRFYLSLSIGITNSSLCLQALTEILIYEAAACLWISPMVTIVDRILKNILKKLSLPALNTKVVHVFKMCPMSIVSNVKECNTLRPVMSQTMQRFCTPGASCCTRRIESFLSGYFFGTIQHIYWILNIYAIHQQK